MRIVYYEAGKLLERISAFYTILTFLFRAWVYLLQSVKKTVNQTQGKLPLTILLSSHVYGKTFVFSQV